MSDRALPASCDVLVIGAGPAGSACAQWLASAGRDVLLIDQHDFPRDKVCGDGLIPDAHAALRRLGVHDEVAQLARHIDEARFFGPRGRHIDVAGQLSVLPRRTLDHVLVRSAQRAGARLLTPLRFEAPLLDGNRVVGARVSRASTAHEIGARWVVLATGAGVGPLVAAGLCDRRSASGIALRGYVRNEAMAARRPELARRLQIVWHPALRGGYGWIFPAPDGCYNIGAGLTGSRIDRRRARASIQDGVEVFNLRDMFDAFCAVHPPAAELMADAQWQGDLKGAPLRCSLQGAQWSRRGLLATGEAIGSTYAFSGEGIGKALETGILAAVALLQPAASDDFIRGHYAAALQGIKPRFDLYQTAAHVNDRPWIADLVIWRAQRSSRIRRRLEGVLEETQNPGRLFSWRGLTRLMIE